ncbi:alanine racemase [Clostridium acetireducens DSM 10703]|jgi:alanine racemase|uniref:Alanine racemase n=1 Tax=Clostridium acetireducens DSM 10703 TaxID=1121290 RepID=A0A1E8EZE8_9CLOT|nr:alanine racemase [Clostridium acetireducens]OFI06526.1 alanine racemase [Clostridium acetireducens DSM 10703]
MFKNHRLVWQEVNLDNLAYNMKSVKSKCNCNEIFAVVKANAYGHGAVEISKVLLENGATGLAVATLEEALELRQSSINCAILVLGVTSTALLDKLVENNIETVVFSYKQALEISNISKEKCKITKIHLAVDTGMGRIGFLPKKESVEECYKISKLPNIKIEGLFSHFSTADEIDKQYSYEQLKKFNWFYHSLTAKGVNIKIRNIANSAAIMELPNTHFEGVRPGIILYGHYPSNEVNKSEIDIKRVMSLKANIVHIKTLDECEYIGYGRKFRTSRKSVIGTLPVGYADGYTRMLSGKAKVIVNGKFAPVVGNICMDQCMVDLTDVGPVNIGDEVILMGSDGNLKFDADDIAKILGTINYEIMCMISKRVPRVYIKNGKILKVQ